MKSSLRFRLYCFENHISIGLLIHEVIQCLCIVCEWKCCTLTGASFSVATIFALCCNLINAGFCVHNARQQCTPFYHHWKNIAWKYYSYTECLERKQILPMTRHADNIWYERKFWPLFTDHRRCWKHCLCTHKYLLQLIVLLKTHNNPCAYSTPDTNFHWMASANVLPFLY
jgi:hypothetical protein